MRLPLLLSAACCGGPVFVLSLALVSFGILFTLLSASELGWVFVGTGAATLGLCVALASEVTGAPHATKWKSTMHAVMPQPPGRILPPGDH